MKNKGFILVDILIASLLSSILISNLINLMQIKHTYEYKLKQNLQILEILNNEIAYDLGVENFLKFENFTIEKKVKSIDIYKDMSLLKYEVEIKSVLDKNNFVFEYFLVN